MSVERRGTKALELWAQRATAGYDHVSISNMTTSWRNGMAFCALVHRYRPDLLEFSSLKPENILENNALAFRLAEQHLGIPALLDAEDMAQSQVPDRLSVLTYVSQYYQVMHQTFTTSGITAPKRKVPSPDISLGQSPTKIKAGLDTTPKTSIVRKSEKVLTGGRGMVCVACTNPVFLAERLMVGSPGQLMHRTCFRCARCSNQLNLASYYETEKGQYCCETCPDEERFISAGQPSSEAAMSTTGSKTSLTNTDNVDTDDSDSDESSDLESRAECPAATSIQDVKHDTIPVISSHNSKPNTPEPIKPRSVFLSKEMLGNTSENDDRISRDSSCENIYSNNLSAVSSSDFEAKSDVSLPDSTGTNDSYKYRLNDCDNAKGYVTDPPESNSKDLNAEQGQSQVNKEKASSIVSERLKMFMDKEAKSKSQSSARYSSNDKYFTKKFKDDNANESIDVRYVVNSSILRNNEKEGMLPFESSRENICEISDTKYNKKSIEEITDTCTKKDIDIDKDKDIDEKNIDCEASTFKSFDIHLDNEKNNKSFEGENTVLVKENSNEFGIEGELSEKNNEICQDDEKEFNPFDEDYEENQEDKSKIDDNIETKIDDIETKIEGNIKTKINDNIESKINDNIGTEINDNIETKYDDNIESKINDNLEKINLIIKEKEPANFDTDEINIKEEEPEKEYPDDLNPFGDDDSDDIIPPALPTTQPPLPTTQPPQTQTNNETYNTSPTIIETTHDDNPPPKPKRIVISANLNPFEDDEDEEDIEPSKKVISAPTKPPINPFWSDDEEPLEETEGVTETSPRPKGAKPPRPPPPTLGRYSSASAVSSYSSASNTPTKGSPGGSTTPRKRTSAPTPPSVNSRELFPQDGSTNDIFGACPPSPTPSTVSRLKKKGRRAPAPPPGPSPISSRISVAERNTGDTTSLNSLGATSMSGSVTSQGKDEEQDEVMSWKQQKEMKNQSNKLIGSSGNDNNAAAVSNIQKSPLKKGLKSELIRRPSLSKSEAGEWQRKKGPAPPRPVPQKRAIKKLPMRTIQTELYDIEIKQTELERQGVLLETAIRGRTESPENPEDSMSSSGPSSIEVEDMILQLFELVNEKNELFRRQTEFMYLKREKRLEEEYAELEYQIRCLMMKPPSEKNETDAAQEEELIGRLVKIVEQRDEITNCLELDRLREAQEDESIANHMMQYQEKHIDGVDQNGVEVVIPKKKKVLKLPKKKKKNKEEKIEKKGKDKDKDVDEIEAKENKKKKKKWFI